MRVIPFLTALPLAVMLAACDAPPPQLADAISPAAQAADYPSLISLAPLQGVEALLPPDRDQVAATLAARSADLRRRAAALRAIPAQ